MPEFLVSMRPIRDYRMVDVILIEADDFDKCIEQAFFSRNIANSWCISNVESDDVEVPKITRDILFEDFMEWRHRNNLIDRLGPEMTKAKRVSWVDYYNRKGGA